MSIELFLLVAVLAFVLELLDASVGMGYGTLAPLLILFGFAIHELVSAVLLTSALLSLFAAGLHHEFKNVNFSSDHRSLKVALILSGFGIIGILLSVFIAVNLSDIILKSYIGILIMAMGILILFQFRNKLSFSWLKITLLGLVASFNKGIAGGGYGPVLATGQIMSGVKSNHAVSITALSEGIVSIAGFAAYIFFKGFASINWFLIGALLIGGILSTPLAVYVVKKINPKKLKNAVGLIAVCSGIFIILRTFIF